MVICTHMSRYIYILLLIHIINIYIYIYNRWCCMYSIREWSDNVVFPNGICSTRWLALRLPLPSKHGRESTCRSGCSDICCALWGCSHRPVVISHYCIGDQTSQCSHCTTHSNHSTQEENTQAQQTQYIMIIYIYIYIYSHITGGMETDQSANGLCWASIRGFSLAI